MQLKSSFSKKKSTFSEIKRILVFQTRLWPKLSVPRENLRHSMSLKPSKNIGWTFLKTECIFSNRGKWENWKNRQKFKRLLFLSSELCRVLPRKNKNTKSSTKAYPIPVTKTYTKNKKFCTLLKGRHTISFQPVFSSLIVFSFSFSQFDSTCEKFDFSQQQFQTNKCIVANPKDKIGRNNKIGTKSRQKPMIKAVIPQLTWNEKKARNINGVKSPPQTFLIKRPRKFTVICIRRVCKSFINFYRELNR